MASVTNKRVALLIANLASFLIPFMTSSVNIALPQIGQQFSMNAILLSWVATSYILAAAMFMLPFGRVGDIFGRKRILNYGVWIYTVASVLVAIAPSGTLLIAFRALQGIGGSMIFGNATAILTSVFAPGERGRVLGINVAVVYIGLSVGPFLGGILTEHFGWRSIFIANVPLGLALLAAFPALKGDWAEARGEKFDFIGSTIYSLTLAAIIYGLTELPALTGIWLIAGGGIGLFSFLQWETRTRSPILHLDLFRNNAVFVFSNLAALVNYSATAAVGFLLSLYLQYIKGLSPETAGIILVSQPVVMAALSPFAGRLSDRVEPRIVASVGMALTCAGLFLLSGVNNSTGIQWIVAWLALLGLGFALFSSPNTNAVMSSVENKFLGVASATLGTMRMTGQMLSMGIAMLLFALYLGQVQILPQYYPQFLASAHTAFIIFGALCLGGIFASLARGKVR